MTIYVRANLLWQWGRNKRGTYIAFCQPIRQTVQANRFEELVATMQEAIESTFHELFSTGDLETFLKEQGWRTESPVPPATTTKNVRFDVPFDLKGVRHRDLKEALC